MSAADLLPPNASDFERALADVLSRQPGVPLRVQRDPYSAAADVLPWLAAHHGVRLWFDDWAETRKRAIIAHHAGLHPVYPGERLGDLVGTRLGLERYLSYVDASLVHALAYPAPFIVGDTAAGSRRVNQHAFTADYLTLVVLVENAEAMAVGGDAIGDAAVAPPDPEPIDRALASARAAKGPAIAVACHFDARRPVTTGDAPSTADVLSTGQFIDRLELSA
ncbi:phage tail protein I [Roseovarius sp. D0-M9]|uniref:phage tail protein I n=1 Tax=Roseovarius sp. D0-M9 TaxID=3127117 RepID=UPI00301060ED